MRTGWHTWWVGALIACSDHVVLQESEQPTAPPCADPVPFGPIPLDPDARLRVGRCRDVLAYRVGAPHQLWRAADGKMLRLDAAVRDWTFTADGLGVIALERGIEAIGMHVIAEDRYDPFDSGPSDDGMAGVTEAAWTPFGEAPAPSLRGRCDDGQIRLSPPGGGWPTLADPVVAVVPQCRPDMWESPHLELGWEPGGLGVQPMDLSRGFVGVPTTVPFVAGQWRYALSVRRQRIVGAFTHEQADCPTQGVRPLLTLFHLEPWTGEPIVQIEGARICEDTVAVPGLGPASQAWVFGEESVWADASGRSLRTPGELLYVMANDTRAPLRWNGDLFVQAITGERRLLVADVGEVIASRRFAAFATTRRGDGTEVWTWAGAEARRLAVLPEGADLRWVADTGDQAIVHTPASRRVWLLEAGAPPQVLAEPVDHAHVESIEARDPILNLQAPEGDRIATLRGDRLEILAAGMLLTSISSHRAIATSIRGADGQARVYAGGW